MTTYINPTDIVIKGEGARDWFSPLDFTTGCVGEDWRVEPEAVAAS